MYEKKINFVLFCFVITSIFSGCKSTKILSDNGTRVIEYREIESEIRDGETELAITGAKLESTSEGIRDSINKLKDTSERLEQSINESTDNESELGEILQQIRDRELTENQLVELGIIGKD